MYQERATLRVALLKNMIDNPNKKYQFNNDVWKEMDEKKKDADLESFIDINNARKNWGEEIELNQRIIEKDNIQFRVVEDVKTYYQEIPSAEIKVEKLAQTKMFIAKGGEKFVTGQDRMTVIAQKGDIVLKNFLEIGGQEVVEDEYIFGNKTESLAQRQENFFAKYEPIAEGSDIYVPQASRKFATGKLLTENICFKMGRGLMYAEAGSVLIEGGYTIEKDSIDKGFYKLPEEERIPA